MTRAAAGTGTLASVSEPISVVTDGACASNGTEDARGGWAAIVRRPDGDEVVLTGGEVPSTNNRMELTAAIEGLRAAPAGSDVELVTDSAYLAHALTKGWLESWRRRGWITASRQPVANRDLWEALIAELERHRRVVPTLVRGHAGHEANERADRLAQQAAQEDRPRRPDPSPDRPAQLGLEV